MKMKEYCIRTKSVGADNTFLTKATTPKGALRRLINNSSDFNMVLFDKTINIKIKELK